MFIDESPTGTFHLLQTPRPTLIPAEILAEFASARHARIFAGLLREAGESVTVTPGVNLLFAVRTLRGGA